MPTPNEAMKEEAQRGLDWRREFGRGGTEVGIARARDIVNGADLSDDTIGRMVSYFARHEVDKQAEGFRPGEDGYPSNGRIAWALWGGDAGKTWAENEFSKIQEGRNMNEMRPFPNEHAARLKDPAQYDSFARENDAGGDGIDFIYGIKDGATELQAIRFDKEKFTPAEARDWLAKHDFTPIEFEVASERDDVISNDFGDACPLPIMDKQTNMTNHLICIQDAQLGPADPANPGNYWEDLGKIWLVPVEQAKQRQCQNCAYYKNTPKILDCIANGDAMLASELPVEPRWADVGDPSGYCIKWDITCTSIRSCVTWESPEMEMNETEPQDIPERKTGTKFTRSDAMEVEIKDERRVQMSISSETPVARSFGDEILVHSTEAIDLSFLNSGRAPLLLDHDPEKQIGVIESVSLDAEARKLRANVRFGKSALASEVYGDVADNIRGNVSIGYQIKKMIKSADGRSFKATSWQPMEASIVSIPADVTVGVGRSMEEIASEAEVETPQVVITETVDEQRSDEPQITETHAEVVAQEAQSEATERKNEMSNDVNVAVASGAFDAPVQQAADVGLSRKEEKSYSLLRAINALANPADRAAQRAAAFELECSEAAQRAYGQSAQGILVPAEILRTWSKRDLNTSDDAGLVPQNYRPGDFIDALRNASSVMQAGATMLTGLSGTVKIPKKSAASSAGWFTEGSASSESEMTTTSITLSPKTAGAYTDISRNMMMGANPSIEALVRQDLSDSIALAIDLGALAGSGSSGQPTGIKNTSGINNPTDFAAANPTWAEVVAMETAVAEDNALRGNLAYILPASMYGALKTTQKATNQAIFVVDPDGTINGYKAIVSNQVTSGDLYFGNFADLLIGMFGGLDILVDPYTGGTAGTVRVIAMQSVDVAVRNAVSFAVNNDGV